MVIIRRIGREVNLAEELLLVVFELAYHLGCVQILCATAGLLGNIQLRFSRAGMQNFSAYGETIIPAKLGSNDMK